jgi:hypothetical protein
MNIEELIDELIKLKDKHGNVKVYLEDMYNYKPSDGCLVSRDDYDDSVKVIIV